MRKTASPLSLVFLVLCASGAAAKPSFSAGIIGLATPGIYDPQLLDVYDSLSNDAGVTLVDPTNPPSRVVRGAGVFAQISWSGLMARASGILTGASGLKYNYTESDTSVQVDDRLLMAGGTLWVGPIVEIAGSGAVYACLGPTLLYGEYRSKRTIGDNEPSSWDRQYAGSGFVLPVMVGVEVRPTRWLGIALECVALGQQIIISTDSKATQGASGVEHDSMLFPNRTSPKYYDGFPVSFWIQLAASFHF